MKKICRTTLLIAVMALCSIILQGCSTGTDSSDPAKEPVFSWKVAGEVVQPSIALIAGFINEYYGITIGGDHGHEYYTIDGGKTWLKSEHDEKVYFYGFDIVDKNTAWMCGNACNIKITTDSAKTWQGKPIFGGYFPNHCKYMSFIDRNTGWIASPVKLGATSDAGMTWNEIALPEGVQEISSIFLKTANEGYILESGGSLFMTKDSGATWTSQDLGFQKLQLKNGKIPTVNAQMAVVNFQDSDHGTVIFNGIDQDGAKIWEMRTSDGGKTWEQKLFPGEFKLQYMYMSHDGKFLTFKGLTDKITLLQYTNS